MRKLIMENKEIMILEIVIAIIFMLKCFGHCQEYVLDSSNFNKSFDGNLTYFDDGSVGLDAQGLEEIELMNSMLRLRSGAYSVKVEYSSAARTDVVNMDNCSGKIILGTDNSKVLKASEILLRDGIEETESRFWLRIGSGENDIKFGIRYFGNGKLAIKSILIEERREYRIIICLAVILLMLMCDLFYFCFIRENSSRMVLRTRFVVAGIIGITLFSSLTYFADFLFLNRGHDLYFHLSRIISLAEGMKELQIPHRIQFEMLNGYGYANPLFYGELLLVLPSVLYNFYIPIQTCYQIFVICVNLSTCIISYWCFMKISQDWKKGLLGAFVYTLAAYRLTDVMVRSAVGEYTALIFFPLLLYGFWLVYNKDKDDKIVLKDYLPIIIAATGIVNSHILSCEMIIIFIVPFVLFNYKITFRKNTIIGLTKCIGFTMMLNAWFIVPFLQSMGMKVNINNKDSLLMIENNTVYLSQLFGIFHTAIGENIWGGAKNEMPLAIGLPFIIGIVVFIYVYIKKDVWKVSYYEMKSALTCLGFGLFAIFLVSNLFMWDNIVYLNRQLARFAGMVQFPWRYLGIATVFLTALIIFTIQILEKHISSTKCHIVMLLIVSSTVLTEGHFMMEFVNNLDWAHVYSESDVGTMGVMGAEYLLQGTNIEGYKNRNILSGENIDSIEFSYVKNGEYVLICKNRSGEDSYIDVPIHFYDNYHAYTSDNEELLLVLGENNVIRINIPGNFDGVIYIQYRVPVLWRVCEIISCSTVFALILIGIRSKLKQKNKKCEVIG